ncbi:MAG: sulfatase [Actinomycetes bacterium]
MSDSFGPVRGFEHAEFATHAARGYSHYAQWIAREHPDAANGFYPVLNFSLEVNEAGGGDTGAPQVAINPVPREWYQTDWVADRTISWLESLEADDDFFCWMSFPDPHHPWDPPQAEMGRYDWRDLDLPEGYPVDRATREAILDAKPTHWRRWYDGTLVSNYEAPRAWVPSTLTPEQILEITARVHVKNELIDEALGRVMAVLDARGWTDTTDVIFTTDHGEFQGDFGLLFKGPYHVDSLMRLPMIWRPAPSAGVDASVVSAPVGILDLAPTFCEIAGLPVPEWMDGAPLPVSDAAADAQGRDSVVTVWDSVHPNGTAIHLRTIHRDGWTCTAALPGTVHDGTEGELYCHAEDPLQRVNRWDDPSVRALRDDLVAACLAELPAWGDDPAPLAAPV